MERAEIGDVATPSALTSQCTLSLMEPVRRKAAGLSDPGGGSRCRG